MKQTKRLLYILLVMLLTGTAIAQAQTFTLQGKVADKDGNPIELASVSVFSQGKLVMTNLKGEFNMTLQSEDSVKVRFAMVGYKTKNARTSSPPRQANAAHTARRRQPSG